MEAGRVPQGTVATETLTRSASASPQSRSAAIDAGADATQRGVTESDVTALLASQASPPMPTEVAVRIEQALAAEASSRQSRSAPARRQREDGAARRSARAHSRMPQDAAVSAARPAAAS